MTNDLYKHRFQGDVQMCVTLILVLGDRIKISQERVEQWFFSYIGKYTGLMEVIFEQ